MGGLSREESGVGYARGSVSSELMIREEVRVMAAVHVLYFLGFAYMLAGYIDFMYVDLASMNCVGLARVMVHLDECDDHDHPTYILRLQT